MGDDMAWCAGVRGAFALLSVAPVALRDEAPGQKVTPWFPWVGLALGGIALVLVSGVDSASVAWGDGEFLHRAAWPLAVLVVGLWAGLTRLLHWDGLADVADGWWGGSTPERRLEIMADSRVGAFGATVVALIAIALVSSLALLIGRTGFGIAIFAAPVFGRAAAMFGAWLGTPARPGGLGARVMGRPSVGAIAVGASGLAIAAAAMFVGHGVTGLVWSAMAFVAALGVPHVLATRFGGVNGDVLGASVLVTETLCLLGAALVVCW